MIVAGSSGRRRPHHRTHAARDQFIADRFPQRIRRAIGLHQLQPALRSHQNPGRRNREAGIERNGRTAHRAGHFELTQVDDRDEFSAGIGDVKSRAVGRESKRVRQLADLDRAEQLHGLRVEHLHAIQSRVGDVKHVARAVGDDVHQALRCRHADRDGDDGTRGLRVPIVLIHPNARRDVDRRGGLDRRSRAE